jgi:hypothetical protein
MGCQHTVSDHGDGLEMAKGGAPLSPHMEGQWHLDALLSWAPRGGH